jgi:2',3'-cyclic-nucleotide 2'-phosphodiesterase/3'-nucleotidase
MFSGVSYEIDITKDAGQRIKNVLIQGQPIQEDKVYKLAVNNYRFGTLISLGLIKATDKYFDSYEQYQDAGRVRDLIIKFVVEQKGGVINPTVDNNWKLVGADYNHPYREDVFELVRQGVILVPMSENGRTPAVKSLNVYELMAEGKLSL